jgi:hypothetical protein
MASHFKGTVVCDGVTLTITEICLRNSQVMIKAEGPMADRRTLSGPMTIFGEDGRGIAQGGHLDQPMKVERGQHAMIMLGLKVGSVDD